MKEVYLGEDFDFVAKGQFVILAEGSTIKVDTVLIYRLNIFTATSSPFFLRTAFFTTAKLPLRSFVPRSLFS
jgi:hypothetical protein